MHSASTSWFHRQLPADEEVGEAAPDPLPGTSHDAKQKRGPQAMPPTTMDPWHRVQHYISERRFDAFESSINGIVATMIKEAAALDPWMPQPVQDLAVKSWELVWEELVDMMRDDWAKCNNAGEFHELQRRKLLDLSTWPPPPRWRPNVLRALRARVLYSLFPADKSVFYVLRQPFALFLMLLLIAPYGISTVAWTLLLLVIDNRGEYQLVNWILLFKVTNFVKWGWLPLLKNYLALYFRATAGDCDVPAPFDVSANFASALFVGSWVLGWLAFGLYKCRRKQRAAELMRIRQLEALHAETTLQGAVLAEDALLTRIMLWDFLSFWLVVLLGSLDLVLRIDRSAFHHLVPNWSEFFRGATSDVHHTYFFELLTCVLGLTSLPFVLFKLPDVGQLMLRMHPTGYDQAGRLRLVLTMRAMKKKWQAEEDLKKMDLDGDGEISFGEFFTAWFSDTRRQLDEMFGPGCVAPRAAVAPALN